MPIRLHHIVIDAHDLSGLARFWIEVLGCRWGYSINVDRW
jgi:extradiol dioxygenase family protein